jgi:hypothetical protein
MSQTCLDCARAEWRLTKAGKLHPDGSGRCLWVLDPILLPKAFFYVGRILNEVPKPNGGFIERKTPYSDCPQFSKKDTI